MAGKTPTTDFIPLLDAQVTLDTEFYVQSDGTGTLPAGEYKGRVSQIVALLESLGFIKVIAGTHIDDAAAIAAGGVAGNGYQLAPNNIYGTPVGPGGIIKIIGS